MAAFVTDSSETDVLVVGGGTAGSILAARLSATRAVTLVEAGRDLTTQDALPPVLVGHPPMSVRALPDTWHYDVELTDSPRRQMNQFRGRILGGSSSINGSLFVRGVPEDYDGWGSPLWDYATVLPFFRRSERDLDFLDELHGYDGPLAVSRALDVPLNAAQQQVHARALSLGIPAKPDINHPRGDGVGRIPTTVASRSTALTYLAPVRARANLRILTDATVTRIVFEGQRALGVETASHGAVRASEVILCAGAFGSAQLLLCSGVGPADDLRSVGIAPVADLPGVGQNLGCHPMCTLRVPLAAEPDPDTPRLVIVHSVDDRNNLMLFPKQFEDHLAVMCTLRLPASRGELRVRSADMRVAPSIAYHYLHAEDLRKLGEGLRLAVALANAAPLEDPSDAWILDHLETADHACGTCRMGPSTDPLAVVDEHCRVYGVDGLRVVDLSIVPRPVRAGPYPTVVMLAERAAELIGMHSTRLRGGRTCDRVTVQF
jgi:choline dehydrogenase